MAGRGSLGTPPAVVDPALGVNPAAAPAIPWRPRPSPRRGPPACGATPSAASCASARPWSGSSSSPTLILIAVFAPVLTAYDPDTSLLGKEAGVEKRSGPCIHLLGCPADKPQHIFGTDGNFRDVLSRVMYGGRISLLIGFAAVGFAIVVGTVIGAVAGYVGGWNDNVLMRFMDVLLAFPSLLLAIAIVTALGQSYLNALLAISIVSIPVYARIVRSSVLTAREADYVTASQGAGRVRRSGSCAAGSCPTRSRRSSCRARSGSAAPSSRSRRSRSWASSGSARPNGAR